MNFAHVLDEQAGHIAAVCAEAARRGVRVVEPTAAAEAAWVATIRERARDQHAFLAGCTPGYYNNEGQPAGPGAMLNMAGYPEGPVAYFHYIDRWRSSGDFDGLEFR